MYPMSLSAGALERYNPMKNRNYKECIKRDQDECIIWSGCNACYYYAKNELICPNCERIMPNTEFKYKKGCLWCLK